jgi:hypothetical protein
MLGRHLETPAERVAFVTVLAAAGAAGLVSATAAFDLETAMPNTAGSIYFLAATFVLAALIALKPEAHARIIFSGLTAASVVAAAAGCIGYFDLAPGAGLFPKSGRGYGTFNGPDGFGAFLVPAFLYAVHSAFERPAVRAVLPFALAGILALGVVISFSRAAWLNLAVAFAIYAGLAVLTAKSNVLRQKIAAVALAGAALVAGVVGGAIQIEPFPVLTAEPTSVAQSYDANTGGRSGGRERASGLIFQHPAGIGAAQVTQLAHAHHHEHAHNANLSMPSNAGWVGTGLFIVLVSATLGAGVLKCFERRPAQPLLVIAYAAFAASALEGVITGTSHWPLFHLLMAVVWGLAAAPGAAHSRAHLELHAPRLSLA